MAPAAAHFPDAIVGLIPYAFEVLEDRAPTEMRS